MAFLYETAARANEVLRLNIEDLDTRERCALVIGKGNRPAWIWWDIRTARLLPRYLDGPSTGPAWLTKRGMRLSWDQAAVDLRRLSEGRYMLHQLRHSRLTHLSEQGISTEMLKAKSRHRGVASLARYARPSVRVVQQWERDHAP